MAKFRPQRVYQSELPNDRSVAVFTDDSHVGIQLTNTDGARTRAFLTGEAAEALSAALNAILAGGGEKVVYQWVAIDTHVFERQPS